MNWRNCSPAEMSAKYCRAAPGHEFHGPYHDREYGFPASDDTVLFAAVVLDDVKRLLNDTAIIRNRLKVEASIDNARRIQAIRSSHGSFAAWLDAHHPRSKSAWGELFRETFPF